MLALADAHRGDALPIVRSPDTTAWWPALDAAQRLAHRTLAACWTMDEARGDGRPTAPEVTATRAGEIESELADLAAATSGRRVAVPEDEGFLAPELVALERALPTARSGADGPQARGTGP
ncbi:hypothetical protein [Actinomycetospora sp. CA-053990]|uniref:hypothetical protein n=1 Tax=Actinomycetospora sp. CA-053990 TaxID=3239891 RepID=UPI003D8BD825